MRRLLSIVVAAGCTFFPTLLPAQVAQVAAPVPATFEGTWETTFGSLRLTQDTERIVGAYADDQGHLSGKVQSTKLTFTYREPGEAGEAWFELAADGQSFRGKYRPAGETQWLAWNGKRSLANVAPTRTFDGLWSSTFGQLRLIQKDCKVTGLYTLGEGSTLEGDVQGRRLTFKYQEPQAMGEGWFELADDGRSFQGQWKEAGNDQASTWTGARIMPVPHRQWLVVLEANYEENLAESEYSFGQMLKTFFARSPEVQVRHRHFHDRRDLVKWCSELAYLNEPILLVFASHGTAEGVQVGRETIGAAAIAEGLRNAPLVKLLHFSSCEIMGGNVPGEIHKCLAGAFRLPISGYCTSVQWATSAVIEFLYFDLILTHHLDPAEAVRQIKLLMPLAGDQKIPGAALSSAGLRLLEP